MIVITAKGRFDTDKDFVALMFDDDNQLNQFLTKIASTEVKTSGVRIITLIPDNKEMTPLQASVLDVINGLDGLGCKNEKESDKIKQDAIDKLQNLIK